MKCDFYKTNPTFYLDELPLGQAFRYNGEMFLAIDEIYDQEAGCTMNAVRLEDGELKSIDIGAEVLPCRMNGHFEPTTRVGE